MTDRTNAASGETRVEKLKSMLDFQHQAIVSRMLVKNAAGSVTLFAFDKGEGLSEHTAPFDALLIGVEGEAEVRVDADIHRLGEGETLLIPAGAPHAVAPRAQFKMLLVMLRSPGFCEAQKGCGKSGAGLQRYQPPGDQAGAERRAGAYLLLLLVCQLGPFPKNHLLRRPGGGAQRANPRPPRPSGGPSYKHLSPGRGISQDLFVKGV